MAEPCHSTAFREGGLPPLRPINPEFEAQRAVDAIIVKLSARCNLACDYCYWFRDDSVLGASRLMAPLTVEKLLFRLREHIVSHVLSDFTIVLHGGEPLLFPKARFFRLCERLRQLEAESGCTLHICLTTNGVLLDDDWAVILAYFRVSCTVSIDGPPELHDRHRPDLRGRETHPRVLEGIACLRAVGLEPGILAVADPFQDPAALLDYFVTELGVSELDVLIPDAVYGDAPPPIADFLIGLFDHWHDHLADSGLRVRFIDAVIRGLAGLRSGVESIGYGPVTAATITSDGGIEAHDVCRIAGGVASELGLATHPLDAIRDDPSWRRIFAASLELPDECLSCAWRHACGGGHIASRWSAERDFANPSVYCSDLKRFFFHVWHKIAPDLVYVAVEPTDA